MDLKNLANNEDRKMTLPLRTLALLRQGTGWATLIPTTIYPRQDYGLRLKI